MAFHEQCFAGRKIGLEVFTMMLAQILASVDKTVIEELTLVSFIRGVAATSAAFSLF